MTGNIKGGATIVVDDAHMAADSLSEDFETDGVDQSSDNAKTIPHNMDSVVTMSALQEKLKCPNCGKSTLRAEFPDQYEVWTKCSSCDFFMGMSNEEWHRMENSPNIKEKIKRMALKKELVT
jgi:predicted RNA-binding Zn-ribbon protein involved in translation (DUF1610 family)